MQSNLQISISVSWDDTVSRSIGSVTSASFASHLVSNSFAMNARGNCINMDLSNASNSFGVAKVKHSTGNVMVARSLPISSPPVTTVNSEVSKSGIRNTLTHKVTVNYASLKESEIYFSHFVSFEEADGSERFPWDSRGMDMQVTATATATASATALVQLISPGDSTPTLPDATIRSVAPYFHTFGITVKKDGEKLTALIGALDVQGDIRAPDSCGVITLSSDSAIYKSLVASQRPSGAHRLPAPTTIPAARPAAFFKRGPVAAVDDGVAKVE